MTIGNFPASIKTGRPDDTPWTFAEVLPTLAGLAEPPPLPFPGSRPTASPALPDSTTSPNRFPERTLDWQFGKQHQ